MNFFVSYARSNFLFDSGIDEKVNHRVNFVVDYDHANFGLERCSFSCSSLIFIFGLVSIFFSTIVRSWSSRNIITVFFFSLNLKFCVSSLLPFSCSFIRHSRRIYFTFFIIFL